MIDTKQVHVHRTLVKWNEEWAEWSVYAFDKEGRRISMCDFYTPDHQEAHRASAEMLSSTYEVPAWHSPQEAEMSPDRVRNGSYKTDQTVEQVSLRFDKDLHQYVVEAHDSTGKRVAQCDFFSSFKNDAREWASKVFGKTFRWKGDPWIDGESCSFARECKAVRADKSDGHPLTKADIQRIENGNG